MKSNTIVKINNKLKNKGITFLEDTKVADIIQAWSFLTRFILDILEDKNKDYTIVYDSVDKTNEYKQYFKTLLNEWCGYTNSNRQERLNE